MSSKFYHEDFYSWVNKQATLLRTGDYSQVDLENLIEELEDMGRSERRELESRLTILLMHLLKWHFQPELRSHSWRYTILEQRHKIARHLRQNPSLQAKIGEILADAYGDAIITAAKETGQEANFFPESCPYELTQILDSAFFPEH